MPILTAVSAFDLHYPETCLSTWNAIKDFVRRNKVGLFVFGGDNLNCEAVSRHTKGKPKYRTLGQMKRELDGFRRVILDPLEKLLPAGCEKIWLTGNHEAWLDQLIEEQPELDGLLDFARYLELKKRGWTVCPQGGHFKKGHLKWIHGDVFGGSNPVAKALNTYVENLVFGHFHTFASATKILPQSKSSKWQAWSTGCVGKLEANFLKGRPTGWITGFSITELRDKGYFNHFPIAVFNGQFSYGGKLYAGK